MTNGTPWRLRPNLRPLRVLLVLAAVVGPGCRVTEKDLERWGETRQGPEKLVAVLNHAKYTPDLRVKAALTLVEMKPRGGRRVGIDPMLEAVGKMPSAARSLVLPGVVNALSVRLQQVPEKDAPDPSIPAKDAAFGLLFHEGEPLLADPGLRTTLEQALIDWVAADFERRLESPGQRINMQQLVRRLGPQSTVALPGFIKPDSPRIDPITQLVADVGDDKTKEHAAQQLVTVALDLVSSQWLERKTAVLETANRSAGSQVDPERFRKQLLQYQEEELMRLFASMRKLGGAPVLGFLCRLATSTSQPEKYRAGALAGLEGHSPALSPAQVEALFQLAAISETPDTLRALTLRRIGERPRAEAIKKLYALFEQDEWQVRLPAAETALAISQAAHVPEFLQALSKARSLTVGEPLHYGQLIGRLDGVKPSAIWPSVERKRPVVERLTALGYVQAHGTQADLPRLQRLTEDPERTPSCSTEARDCSWICQDEAVKTVGDFVRLCVEPSLRARSTDSAKSAPP